MSRPSRWAIAAASPRPAAPSLARILETWTLAVLGVMYSAWPICRFVRPAATNASTSASRCVRPSEAAGEEGASGDAVVSEAEAAPLGKQLDLAPQRPRPKSDRCLVRAAEHLLACGPGARPASSASASRNCA